MTPKDKFAAELAELVASHDEEKVWAHCSTEHGDLAELDKLQIVQQLFEQPTHGLHNDLAYVFQRAAHPETAEWIFDQVMGGNIPEIDDYLPISRVFTWALADIGGEAAWHYLQKIAASGNKFLESYARKRLASWSKEAGRKTLPYPVNGWSLDRIYIEGYRRFREKLPSSGRHIVACQTEEEIVVYQAYNHEIADWAVSNQQLGGEAFSYNRMSWIKPNFLWMMYRCGWASKENQERVLAITIRKTDWEEILSRAVFSSYQPDVYGTREHWKDCLTRSPVRLQWDPAHHPKGTKLERKAIQIGMKGEVLRQFGTEMILRIDDMTEFVKWQKVYLDNDELDHLLVPKETVYAPSRKDLRIGL